MVLEKVSGIAMTGMVLQIIIGFGVPIGLMYLLNKKLKARFGSFYVGCLVYFIAVFILQSMVNNAVFGGSGDALRDNVVLLALYTGAAAAVFEEVGRFIAFRMVMKDRTDAQNGIMYGLGHGGLEMILILALNGINTYITSVMVNNGTLAKSLDIMDEAMKLETYNAAAALWNTQAWVYFVGIAESLFALLLNVALSMIVYKAVKAKHYEMVATAMIIHFVVDFASVVFSKTLPVGITETLVAIMSIATAYYAILINTEELAKLPGFCKILAKPVMMRLFKIEAKEEVKEETTEDSIKETTEETTEETEEGEG